MATNEYIRNYREKRKNLALKMLGGKCVKCNATENLQFDHIDPNMKISTISSMLTSNIVMFIAEIEKCQLLCYACHLKKSAECGDYVYKRKRWEHGVSGYINHKCRCITCVDSYKDYRAKRWAREKR
jgi:hypothetical protein